MSAADIYPHDAVGSAGSGIDSEKTESQLQKASSSDVMSRKNNSDI